MPTDDMEKTLDVIQFFSNSANSVRVFETLADGSMTGREIADQTGASRSTVGRILNEGESRGWIDSEGSQYELTHVGQVMIDEFHTYLETVRGIQHLGAAINWLPRPARMLDYCHFYDAEIITPTATRPAEPYDYVADRIRTANELYTLSPTGVPRLTKLCDEQSTVGELEVSAVIQTDFFETLATDPEVLPHWRALTERDDIYTYDGDIPIGMHIVDETVILWLTEPRGGDIVVRGVLVTENPAVTSWAESFYEEYQAEAAPLDPASLTET